MIINNKTKNFLLFSLSLLRYKKGITFVNILCNIVIFCRVAAVTYIVRQVLNLIESTRGTALRQAAPYLLALLAVIGIRIIAIMGCATLDTLRSYYYQNRTRLNVLRTLLKTDDITAVAGRSGAIFEVLGNDISICTFPAELLTEVTGYCMFTLVALSMMFSINWQLTLFIFIPLSAAIYLIQRLTDRIKEKRYANREAQDMASSFAGDVADTVLAVKAAGAEGSILRRYDQVNKNRRAAVLKDTLLNEKIRALLDGSVYAGSAIMMFAAARLMTGGNFRLGDFSLFIVYLGTLADCVNRIVELIAESRKAEVSYERILKTAEAMNNKTISADVNITLRKKNIAGLPSFSGKSLVSFEVKNLSFEYGEGKGFRDISFDLGPGQLMAVTGEIGTGKSTLASVLMGLLPADNGGIFLDGEKVSAENRGPGDIAGAPQRSGFFSMSLAENINLGTDNSEEEIHKALYLAALDDLVSSGGLDMDLGSRGTRLSGGQQQRLALARMYMRGARVNIIDDCISALDLETRLKVLTRLKDYLRNTSRAAIIVTNEPSFINSADRVLNMNNK